MLTFSTKGTVKNIFIIIAHIFYFRISLSTLLQISYYNQVEVVNKLYVVINYLLSTTLSINPKSFALSGVIKLSLSSALEISSTDFPVCFE